MIIDFAREKMSSFFSEWFINHWEHPSPFWAVSKAGYFRKCIGSMFLVNWFRYPIYAHYGDWRHGGSRFIMVNIWSLMDCISSFSVYPAIRIIGKSLSYPYRRKLLMTYSCFLYCIEARPYPFLTLPIHYSGHDLCFTPTESDSPLSFIISENRKCPS